MTFLEFIEDESVHEKVALLRSYDGTDAGTAVLEAIDTMLAIRQTLSEGGRIFLLTSDETPMQELILNNEV